MQNISVLITGIGGQGIILASDILAQTALRMGKDVKKTDSIGMAQRGGSVISHVRIGEVVNSPLIPAGGADVLFSMEKLEAARSCHFLKTGGKALVNRYAVPPLSVTSGGSMYPEDDVIIDTLKKRTPDIFFIDGLSKIAKLGNNRTLNVFFLGALSALLPLSMEDWKESLVAKLPPKILKINLEAFTLGQEEMKNAGIG